MWLASQNDALVGAWFEQQKHFPSHLPARAQQADDPVLIETQTQLRAYFDARLSHFDLPLAPQGTAFQQAVWKALLEIAHGTHSTYGAIATQLRKPNASRAVGAAVGRNPISIIIPCHRVVGSTGAMTGYAGGVERKLSLLKLESTATVPASVTPKH
jgi:methylated-DNA-[protein]-cysteine S-methyltransferase